MRALFLFLCLLWGQAWGADHYVCETAQGAADGTSAANCKTWSFADNEFAAGDTLYVCGEINTDTALIFNDLGTASSRIHIDSCPGNPGILDGNGTATPVLQLGSAGEPASYVTVRNLTVRDSAVTAGSSCILDSSLGAGGGFNVIEDSVITDCGYYAILGQKPSLTIDSNDISYCFDDCIGISSAALSPIITSNTCSYFSTGTTTGDCVFINNGAVASNPVINYNVCNWDTAASTKQCFIMGVASGYFTARGNQCISRVDTTTNHCISMMAATDAFVSATYCDGMRACVTHFADSAEGIDNSLTVTGTIANGSQYLTLISTTVGAPIINLYNNTAIDCGTRCVEGSGAGTALTLTNNVLDAAPGAIALYTSNTIASYAGDYNDFYPEGASFIQNNECGSTYSTLAAYKAGCASVDQHSVSADPSFVGGTSPNTPAGFCLESDSALLGAGTYIGAYILGYGGESLSNPPPIGARGLCQSRRAAASRRAASR